MRTLAAYVPGLICVGGMLLCMRMMRRGSNAGDASCHEPKQEATTNAKELAELHEEVTRLRAEVRLQDRQEEPHL